MASIITATTTSGLTQSADNSGVLQLASGTGNLVTVPSVTGTAMVSGNMPAFASALASNQTISHNTVTKLTLNTEVIDTNNCYDPTTNYRFTPNVAGYYQINAKVQINGTASRNYLFQGVIYKNGSVLSNSPTYLSLTVGSGGDNNISLSMLVYMNGSTDYLEFYVYQYDYSASGSVTATAYGTSFSGSLVRAS
jgi:hypothetical protein